MINKKGKDYLNFLINWSGQWGVLYIISNQVQFECKLAARLYIKLGGRKVDILIKDNLTKIRPIYQQALTQGVIL